MSKSLFLVDTNILVYADDEGSSFYQLMKSFLEENLLKHDLAISAQNIIEYYSLVTNPQRISKPVSPEATKDRIKKWLETGLYKIISPTIFTPMTLLRILEKSPLKGPDIFDAYLAATMIDNGIDTICTADEKIFQRLGLKTINPLT